MTNKFQHFIFSSLQTIVEQQTSVYNLFPHQYNTIYIVYSIAAKGTAVSYSEVSSSQVRYSPRKLF